MQDAMQSALRQGHDSTLRRVDMGTESDSDVSMNITMDSDGDDTPSEDGQVVSQTSAHHQHTVTPRSRLHVSSTTSHRVTMASPTPTTTVIDAEDDDTGASASG
eukprot:m.192553 g.192553  ORF g.192553 m.192553 type:complete len:104 (-) comp18675_c0_seq1:2195-2506(-)